MQTAAVIARIDTRRYSVLEQVFFDCFARGTPEQLAFAFAQFWNLANRVQDLIQLPEDQEAK